MSKQSKKSTAPNEVMIPMKEVTQVHPKPKAESPKRKVPRYQMTKGIVGFVSAVKAIHPNAVSIHILYKPKEVKTKDKFENYAIDPIGMLVKTKDGVLGVNYEKLFEIFNDRILIRIKDHEKKSVKNFSKSNLASLSIQIDKEKEYKKNKYYEWTIHDMSSKENLRSTMSEAKKEFMKTIVVEEDSVVSLAEEELDNIVF